MHLSSLVSFRLIYINPDVVLSILNDNRNDGTLERKLYKYSYVVNFFHIFLKIAFSRSEF